MSAQGIKLTAIADAIREKEGTTAVIPANTFADRILDLPVGIENPSVTLPTASTQEEQFSRIAAAIKAKEGSPEKISANEFANRILSLSSIVTEKLDPNLKITNYNRPARYGTASVTVSYEGDGVLSASITNGLRNLKISGNTITAESKGISGSTQYIYVYLSETDKYKSAETSRWFDIP